VLLTTIVVGCGKRGPPLPPLVRVPIPPANLTADRRGDEVDLEFTVPDANTDRTRPANIQRVDVYAITAPASVTDDQILKHGTKVASVDVKSPRDPNQTVEEDEPKEDMEPAVGAGLDQGAVAHVDEELTSEAFEPAELGKDRSDRPIGPPTDGNEEVSRPLLGPPPAVPSRIYAAVGVSARGRKGPLSKRVVAPLIDPPPVPAAPNITYTEEQVTVTWPPVTPAAAPTADDLLPSRPIGLAAPTIAYNVYDVSQTAPQKITKTPVAEPKFTDPRIVWGEKRCYTVRTVTTVSGASIESDAAPPSCETLSDTFPPAPPKSLRSIAGEGTINLIWDPNTEKDLAGYIVFRGTGDALAPLTPQPIQDTTFTDKVQPGERFIYAIKAIDKAGNSSTFSERTEETARE
jgi:hypothetical protein